MLTEPSQPLTADVPMDSVIICLDNNDSTGNVMLAITGGTPPYAITGSDTSNLAPGMYSYLITDSKGCTTALNNVRVVNVQHCILPYYVAPDSGKVDSAIGPELTQLVNHPDSIGDTVHNAIFQTAFGNVLIEVIANVGYHDSLLALLLSPDYGMFDTISNGDTSQIITGEFPVANLTKLNNLPSLVDYVRPYYPPVGNNAIHGLAYSLGDVAVRGNAARSAFGLDGSGIKVGVISDSYNTLPGNPAATDVSNGDLPGLAGGYNPNPVEVVQEYPFGQATDEGRAMLQIVHDVAPKAKLAFCSGYVSAGNMALGIMQLQQDSVNVIVDDITYITEPFFKDGVIAQAVNAVTAKGVSYFSAAGNFGNESYEGTYTATANPGWARAIDAHDFGGGNIYQSISLLPGTYTIVLQWDDSIYSLGQIPGALNDLDIYLADRNGNPLFGMNKMSLGGDPYEVLPFTVLAPCSANVVITRAAGTGSVNFKYVVFRGATTITEFGNTNVSTVVGQANAKGAMAVGAARYTNTPAFGVSPPVLESYSSDGGTITNDMTRRKPDFVAPDGVNTTVNLGDPLIPGNPLPTFYGTSAAAPHAAAVAALMMQAKKKFYGDTACLSPDSVRCILERTAISMGAPGFNYASGYGFIQADAAIQTFASPKPFLDSIGIQNGVDTPGMQASIDTLFGNYFSGNSQAYLGNDSLPTTVLNSQTIIISVPTFIGNPPVSVCTQGMTPTGLDGGCSDSLYFYNPTQHTVVVTAIDTVMRYGERIPVFTAMVTVDGRSLANAGYTLTDLGLDSMQFSTTATSLSNVGLYGIIPMIDTMNVNDSANVVYKYVVHPGILTINQMPLTIIPRDTTLIYGDKISGIQFTTILIPQILIRRNWPCLPALLTALICRPSTLVLP